MFRTLPVLDWCASDAAKCLSSLVCFQQPHNT